TGLPSASETFSRAVSKLRTRRERRLLVVSGTVRWKPGRFTEPTYRPKNCTTRASFGLITVKPDATTATSRLAVPTPIAIRPSACSLAPYGPVNAHQTNAPAAASSSTRARKPGIRKARFSIASPCYRSDITTIAMSVKLLPRASGEAIPGPVRRQDRGDTGTVRRQDRGRLAMLWCRFNLVRCPRISSARRSRPRSAHAPCPFRRRRHAPSGARAMPRPAHASGPSRHRVTGPARVTTRPAQVLRRGPFTAYGVKRGPLHAARGRGPLHADCMRRGGCPCVRRGGDGMEWNHVRHRGGTGRGTRHQRESWAWVRQPRLGPRH